MTEHVRPDLLNDYAEGLLDDGEAHGISAHLAACARCAAEVEAVRALRSAAGSLPRSLDPGVDLRPGIRAARQRRRSAVAGAAAPRGRVRLLAAAAVLAIALASLPALLSTVRGPADAPPAAALPPDAAMVLVLDREYDRAAGELKARLEGADGRIPADAARLLSTSLATVDRALTESRAALREDPGSPVLRELVLAAHRQRLDVLRQAAELAAEGEEAT